MNTKMSVLIRTDVTAVKCFRNFVLAGIGSSLHVFEKETGKLLHIIVALNGQKIYGLVPSVHGDKILVFGGKQFTAVTVDPSSQNSDLFHKLFEGVVCDDWLHSAIWMDDQMVAVLTAHNVVQKWNITQASMISQHTSKDNSILYSGTLLPLQDDVLVMAGTVFSDVIVHWCGDDEPLHHLRGHRGVIFSISCRPERGVTVTTSDDRSVRIWEMTSEHTCSFNSIDYWKNLNIVCKHELYGHTARVMRNCVTDDLIISVGEDSAICFWDHAGKLCRKNLTHHNAPIWSLDADEEHLVTGGGDSGVILHPLSIAKDYSQHEVLNINATPKKVLFTARRNIIVLSDTDDLVHINIDDKNETRYKLQHESTYKLISLSSCKQMISVADMSGKLDVFVESCKDVATLLNIIDIKLNIGKILSMQWAGNRHLILCSENGQITVLASNYNSIDIYAKFILPVCKERRLTASAINYSNDMFVLGDRCGNIHIFVKGKNEPIKSFSKVHGRYGPTSILIKHDNITTTGRDGKIKYFCTDKEYNVRYMNSNNLEFPWVEKFLDNDERLICGFQERVFVVCNVRTDSKILEVNCGGGHRSWDAIRYINKVNDTYEESIQLIYLKNSEVNLATFQLSKIVSRNIVNGTHSKEINCMKVLKCDLDRTKSLYISGGEDTTVRVSTVDSKLRFGDEVILKHLSSVRALKICPLSDNELLLITAGGRAQIRINILNFYLKDEEINFKSIELIDHLIKGTDKERKGNQTWRDCSIDFDPETRIMDLDCIQTDKELILFVGCSDACLRVFKFHIESKSLSIISQNNYHETCILKTSCFQFLNKNILVTCTSRGQVTFWDIDKDVQMHLFLSITVNKSGVNSLSVKVISNDKFLIATGGDDNAIYLNVLEIPDEHNLASARVAFICYKERFHSSQVTGVVLFDNFLVSTSIDQRITLFEWSVGERGVICDYVSQTCSDVADIQGMELQESSHDAVTVCVFGKGMEVITVPIPKYR